MPAVVAVHAHEAMGQDSAAQEAAELALHEAGHGSIPVLGAGQEGLELLLYDPIEDALLGAAARVIPCFALGVEARRVRGERCLGGHGAAGLRRLCQPQQGARARLWA